MPQATTLRLVRGRCEVRPRATGSALTMVQQHATHMRRIHTLARSMASDADVLVEALRYFIVAPPRRVAGS